MSDRRVDIGSLPALSRGEVALAAVALALVAASAQASLAREAAAGRGVALPPAAAGGIAAVITLIAAALEAAAYGMAWRALARPYAFGVAFTGTLSLTMFESLAWPLIARAHDEPALAPALAWLVGPRALGAAESGLAIALAGAGLLAMARVAVAAHVQSRAARVRWRGAFVVVLAGWLLTRLVLWWTVDLVMGRSIGVNS